MHPYYLHGVPEDDMDASKHVGVLTIYKILFIYIYTLCFSWSGKQTVQEARTYIDITEQDNFPDFLAL